MIDFTQFPSPCYIMEEELLRKNLSLIKQVADKAGVEIILAFKSFAMWRSFPIFREYIAHSTASSVSTSEYSGLIRMPQEIPLPSATTIG